MKRRDFLQRASWIVGALGLSGNEWLQLGNRYYQVIAQSSPRKLALLVGINQYSHQALTGCITDIELQRQLLIHRFGFKPVDILTLSDRQASRQQIETAFLEHLTGQAQPGDLVVFHFSGYGRRVQLETANTRLNSLVPVDSVVSTSGTPMVNDLLEETLWLLLRSLNTNRAITVLDTGYNAASDLQGNLRIRALPELVQAQLSIQASDFQAQLLGQGKINPVQPLPGIVLAASGASQAATEAQWSGFSAGLFTYALTQCLWEATKATTVQVILSQITGTIEQLGGRQQPVLSGDSSQEQSKLADYFIPETDIGADGVVIAVGDDGKTAHLWLAGLPLPVLEYYAANSILVVTPVSAVDSREDSQSSVQLQVRSRTGLTAKAQIYSSNDGASSLQVGQRVRESVRVLPRNINLTIALDTKLERIERVDATSAFAVIPSISSAIAGEQSADYLFGRVQDASSTSSSRYGLFSLSQELIPNTTGEPGEAVKVAVQRLVPKLQTLLAAKLWRLTTNKTSSNLEVRAALETIKVNEQILIQQQTWHESNDLLPAKAAQGSIPTVSIGSRIQYRVHNKSSLPVYLVLLSLDSNKNAVALYPTSSNEAATEKGPAAFKQLAIAPGETIIVPQLRTDWVVRKATGVAETQLIFSRANFSQTMVALDAVRYGEQPIIPMLNPVEVAQAVLQDLHQASAAIDSSTSPDTYKLDVNAWASLSFIYQVV